MCIRDSSNVSLWQQGNSLYVGMTFDMSKLTIGSTRSLSLIPFLTDGEWHHYVCVHTNGSTYLYIDGVKAAEALNKGLKPIDRKPYFIGRCV